MPRTKRNELSTGIPVVFVSYAWADQLSALAIDQWLRDRGARVLIDQREFVPGNDIEAEIVRCIEKAGKVVCVYSGNSANRPYPTLERRITAALEKRPKYRNANRRRLIYFCIDKTPLPTEALPRLAIMAFKKSFDDACEELWRSILGAAATPKRLDLTSFKETPPWNKTSSDVKFVSEVLGLKESLNPNRIDQWVEVTRRTLTTASEEPLDIALHKVEFLLSEEVEKCDRTIAGNAQAHEDFSAVRKQAEESGRDRDGLGAFLGAFLSLSVGADRAFEQGKLGRLRRAQLEIELHEKRPRWHATGDMLKAICSALSEKDSLL